MTSDPPATLDEPDTDAEVIEKLRAENERLRGALEPFARFADAIDKAGDKDGGHQWRDEQSILSGLTAGAFRLARKVITNG